MFSDKKFLNTTVFYRKHYHLGPIAPAPGSAPGLEYHREFYNYLCGIEGGRGPGDWELKSFERKHFAFWATKMCSALQVAKTSTQFRSVYTKVCKKAIMSHYCGHLYHFRKANCT